MNVTHKPVEKSIDIAVWDDQVGGWFDLNEARDLDEAYGKAERYAQDEIAEKGSASRYLIRVTEERELLFDSEPAAPKLKKGFKQAGPTPDGGFIERRTDNDYSHAVVVFDTSETVWKAGKGYHANPSLNTWVSYSWHGNKALALKSVEKARRFGYRAAIVEVVAS